MNTISRLFVPCRIVRQSHYPILAQITLPVQPIVTRVIFNINTITQKMAQRSITSFFKASPPKPVVKQKEPDNDQVTVNDDDDKAYSPITDVKSKVSKRCRIDSSESDSSPKKQQSSPASSEKKKKVKRQRIESSGSESEASPVLQKKTITSTSPVQSQENIADIKIEKTASPKTYSSPKSKKNKPLVEHNKKSPSPKKITNESSVKNGKKEVAIKEEKVLESEVKSKSENISTGENKDIKSEAKELVPENEYNPAKPKYHPINDACWAAGAAVPYLALARTFELIEATSARLKMVETLSNFFRSVIILTPEDLLPSVYLCLNQLAPAYESLELGIAETYLMKAIGQCTGRTLAQVKAQAARSGDLGQVGERARAAQRTLRAPPPLSARNVLAALQDIARISGHASVNKKINKIQSLYIACRHSEARYLIRSLEGKLRIGLAEQSVLQALALATATTPPDPDGVKVLDASKGMSPEKFKEVVDEHALIIKTTYCECPNYSRMIPVLLQHGVRALPQHCRLEPGVPLKPMLAHPTKQLAHVLDRFENEKFTCEWKYDGERAQIHVPARASGDAPDFTRAAVFSRNQENNTSKYPDLLSRLPTLLGGDVTSCVLDCEAVAYDTVTNQILPFQILSTRKRKEASESEIKVQVCVFVFDLLYLNGASLVAQPLCRRRQLLREHFRETQGSWQFATSKDCSTLEEVQQFMDEAVRGSCEGLMVKALDGPRAAYDIARRSHNWLKLKKDYLEGVGDSIDVVVLGAYSGRGRRGGVFGGFLLACYEPQHDEYQSLCKIGTGFSDDDLHALTASLKEHVIDAPKTYYRYSEAHAADVWVSARAVWEVRAADLSLSGAHRAALGLVAADKGISLRFPRFIRVRDDKTPEQATTAQQIADMYLAQDQVKNTATRTANIDDFY